MNLPLSREQLHDYQNKSVEFIKSTHSCALWVDLGLGKTVTTLTAISDLIDSIDVLRVLVIAPLRVAMHTWPCEIKAWSHTHHLTFGVMAGPLKQRLKILNKPSHIHIINRELVPWLVDTVGRNWPYDMVVIDEASSFKSPRSKRFKALKKALPHIDRMVQLTGTPASNGLLDVWSQLFLLDKGERLGRTFGGYRNRYFTSDYFGYQWAIRDGAEARIHDKLQDICLTLSTEDYLTLPPRIDNLISLKMPDSVSRQYHELEKEFLLSLNEESVEATNAAALTNKLLQFCNGAVYTNDKGEWVQVHDEKLDALEEIIQASSDHPILVAYTYKSDLERIKQRFPEAEHLGDASDTIERWNAGKIPLLLAHPASAGHGLNLQKGGNTVVWFGLTWSLELYQQFNGRLHRQGQTKPVIVHHLIVDQSVDGVVIEALKNKNVTQNALLNALKTHIVHRTQVTPRI